MVFREVLDQNKKNGWIKAWGMNPISLDRPNSAKNYVVILLDKTRVVGKPVNGSNQHTFLVKSNGLTYVFSNSEQPRVKDVQVVG